MYSQQAIWKQHLGRHMQIIKELRAHTDTSGILSIDPPENNLAFEGTEDDHTERDIDVHVACAMADEAVARGQEVVESNAKADVLNDFVAVFFVDEVFYFFAVFTVEFMRWDLDEI
jgi:hypothetical protein